MENFTPKKLIEGIGEAARDARERNIAREEAKKKAAELANDENSADEDEQE